MESLSFSGRAKVAAVVGLLIPVFAVLLGRPVLQRNKLQRNEGGTIMYVVSRIVLSLSGSAKAEGRMIFFIYCILSSEGQKIYCGIRSHRPFGFHQRVASLVPSQPYCCSVPYLEIPEAMAPGQCWWWELDRRIGSAIATRNSIGRATLRE